MYNNEIINLAQRQKNALIRQKRDEAIAKRTERKNRRTFPPSNFQLNPIIAPMDEPIMEPDIIEPIMEPIDELVYLIENCIKDPIEDISDIINPALIAQAEELRKLMLLQETIKRFSKKKI